MIQATGNNITVTSGNAITFNGTQLRTGCTAVKSADNKTFYLNRKGIYMISFNAYGASTAAGTIGAQLTVNGIGRAEAISTATTAAGAPQAISFQTLVAVPDMCRCAGGLPIAIQYIGSPGTLNLANLIITKLR